MSTNTSSRTILAAANALAWAGVIAMNALANALPINGLTTGELSDMYPNLFVPAGFTFSIWGAIYLLLLGYVIFQFSHEGRRARLQVGIWWIINAIANASWIVVWHHKMIGTSLVIMLVLLITLFIIHTRLRRTTQFTLRERLFVRLPFSFYFGWISVATIANTTALLVDIGWNGFGLSESTWAVIMIMIALSIAVLMLLPKRDIGFGLAVAWAFFGIYSKQIDGTAPIVAQVAGLGVVVVLVMATIAGIRIVRSQGRSPFM